jgi:hypothetical protein
MNRTANYEVFSQANLVGWSAFEHRDPPMGVAFGRFLPAPGYAGIRDAVRETLDNSDRVIAQGSLHLRIRTPEGSEIPSKNGVSIADASTEQHPNDIEVEMLGVPDFDRYFGETNDGPA